MPMGTSTFELSTITVEGLFVYLGLDLYRIVKALPTDKLVSGCSLLHSYPLKAQCISEATETDTVSKKEVYESCSVYEY